MIKKILIAIDGSPASNRAVGLGAEMASVHDASLYLLNVIRDIQIPADMRDMGRVENLGETRLGVLEHVANQILDNAEERARKKGAKTVRKSIGRGDPATMIARYAKRHKIDLILIGTRGLGKVKGMLMGSVSRKVADICDVNCLIVR